MQRFMVPARLVARSVAALSVLLLFPAAAFAQAAITGVVKDASGGVLPGVTVEVASPVLIEKVRSVATDATGQYRVVDLRPGTYSVTFSLAGFKTVKREGIELTGTICGHGERRSDASARWRKRSPSAVESPTVDVQSVLVQQTVSSGRDRRHSQLAERLRDPVLDSRTERVAGRRRRRWRRCRRHRGWHGGPRRDHPRREHLWFADQDRRAEHGFHRAGHCRRAAPEHGRRVGSGDQHLRRAGRSGRGRGEPQHHPEGRRQHVQGIRLCQRRDRLDAGQQLHAVAQGPGPEDAGKAEQPVRRGCHGWRPDRPGQALVLRDLRQVGSNNTVPGMWVNKNANNPNLWVVDFDLSQPAFTDTMDRSEASGVSRGRRRNATS